LYRKDSEIQKLTAVLKKIGDHIEGTVHQAKARYYVGEEEGNPPKNLGLAPKYYDLQA